MTIAHIKTLDLVAPSLLVARTGDSWVAAVEDLVALAYDGSPPDYLGGVGQWVQLAIEHVAGSPFTVSVAGARDALQDDGALPTPTPTKSRHSVYKVPAGETYVHGPLQRSTTQYLVVTRPAAGAAPTAGQITVTVSIR